MHKSSEQANHFNSDSIRIHIQQAHVMRAELIAVLFSELSRGVRNWIRSLTAGAQRKAQA